MTAEDLKNRRLALGLTRDQLALEAGCAKNTILNIENGKTTRRGLVAYRIESTLTKLEEDASVNSTS